MAQYGDEYGHVQNQEFDSQAVHDKTNIDIAGRGIVTHQEKNGLSSGDNPQQQQPQQEKIHRSNSSSSSEDEGEGGARKKIMEKIPGVGSEGKQSQDINPNTTTTTIDATIPPSGEAERDEQKKGKIEKIKEMLTGDNPKKQQDQNTTTIDGIATPGHNNEHGNDKKGLVDKIKDKLP